MTTASAIYRDRNSRKNNPDWLVTVSTTNDVGSKFSGTHRFSSEAEAEKFKSTIEAKVAA